MHGYHHYGPLFYLLRQFKYGILIVLALFVLLNPVTLGIALALVDHFAPGTGRWFLGFGQ